MPKDISKFYNIEDLRLQAKKNLPHGIFDFIDGGAEDGIAVETNRSAYIDLKIKNRVLIDVSKRSTETEIFGKKIAMPYGISPTGAAGPLPQLARCRKAWLSFCQKFPFRCYVSKRRSTPCS